MKKLYERALLIHLA